MNLHDEENRLALQTWVSDMRASVLVAPGHGSISLPDDRDERLARLKEGSELHAAGVDQAINCFSRKKYWPALSESEFFYLNLRVLAACRTIDSLLSGDLTGRLDIVEAIGSDNPNFTEWILTAGWAWWGEPYLQWLADADTPENRARL